MNKYTVSAIGVFALMTAVTGGNFIVGAISAVAFYHGATSRLKENVRKKNSDDRWVEFQAWKTNYQSDESKKHDIEKQWMDFDEWKVAN